MAIVRKRSSASVFAIFLVFGITISIITVIATFLSGKRLKDTEHKVEVLELQRDLAIQERAKQDSIEDELREAIGHILQIDSTINLQTLTLEQIKQKRYEVHQSPTLPAPATDIQRAKFFADRYDRTDVAASDETR